MNAHSLVASFHLLTLSVTEERLKVGSSGKTWTSQMCPVAFAWHMYERNLGSFTETSTLSSISMSVIEWMSGSPGMSGMVSLCWTLMIKSVLGCLKKRVNLENKLLKVMYGRQNVRELAQDHRN